VAKRGFPYDSTLPLLAAFAAACAFLGLVVVIVGGDSSGSGAQAASTTAQTTTETSTTPPPDIVVAEVTLTVATAGDGSGMIDVDGTSRDCSDECRSRVEEGTSVTLIARPAAGSRFVSWTGSCGSPRRCSLTMDRARSATALFTLAAPVDSDPAAADDCDDGIDIDADGLLDGEDPDCLDGDSEDPLPPADASPPPAVAPPPAPAPSPP